MYEKRIHIKSLNAIISDNKNVRQKLEVPTFVGNFMFFHFNGNYFCSKVNIWGDGREKLIEDDYFDVGDMFVANNFSSVHNFVENISISRRSINTVERTE
jgi:hypothetical protein